MSALVAKYNKDHQTTAYETLPFADRKKLAGTSVRFCVTNVAKVHQHDGNSRWYLTITFIEDMVLLKQTLTFDPSPSRDELFTIMHNSLPQHNCYLELIKVKGGRTFYNFNQDEDDSQCVCIVE